MHCHFTLFCLNENRVDELNVTFSGVADDADCICGMKMT